MDWNFWIFCGVVVLLFKNFLPSYFNKKGENLATKEDIEDITKQVEEVKAAIGSRLYVSQIRYQNEFTILQDLTEKVVQLKDAARALRPALDSHNPNESEEQRKEKRLDAYSAAAVALYKTSEMKMPFYPDEIYKGIRELDLIARREAIEYSMHDTQDRRSKEYWESAQKNAAEIEKLTGELLKIIRNRAKYWETFGLKN